jgi:rsbT co-antagonist protein RsbR
MIDFPMAENRETILPGLLKRQEKEILRAWTAEQIKSHALSTLREHDRERLSGEFLNAFQRASQTADAENIESEPWREVRNFLADLSSAQAKIGATPIEVATFIFSLKQILFRNLEEAVGKDPEQFAQEIWLASQVIDRLGLYTTQLAMKGREEVISRQQMEMLELSTPVVKLWDGVLALPLIGTLDSERTQVVMESLLQEIVRSGSGIAIIDITGVPTVDTLVAQHLLKTVAAARLMGAECIISGIRPQIASTIVHLGVNLGDVTTKATLADAFAIALRRNGLVVTKAAAQRRAVDE